MTGSWSRRGLMPRSRIFVMNFPVRRHLQQDWVAACALSVSGTACGFRIQVDSPVPTSDGSRCDYNMIRSEQQVEYARAKADSSKHTGTKERNK